MRGETDEIENDSNPIFFFFFFWASFVIYSYRCRWIFL